MASCGVCCRRIRGASDRLDHANGDATFSLASNYFKLGYDYAKFPRIVGARRESAV
jgi:hypothetical protein